MQQTQQTKQTYYWATIKELSCQIWSSNIHGLQTFSIWSNKRLIKDLEYQTNQKSEIGIIKNSCVLLLVQSQFLVLLYRKRQIISVQQLSAINIQCDSNSLITSSIDRSIVKIDIIKRQQVFIIREAHQSGIYGLDYNQIYNRNVIASGSNDYSIKLWDGNNGNLLIEQKKACRRKGVDYNVKQIFIITQQNQLVSIDYANQIIIWNVSFQEKQLSQQQSINGFDYLVCNISLIMNQQFIISIGSKKIQFYDIQGKLIIEFLHKVCCTKYNNVVQQDIKIVIQGDSNLSICNIKYE